MSSRRAHLTGLGSRLAGTSVFCWLHSRIATFVSTSSASLKPVLNWVNVCSPNILRTVRRTMIRFLHSRIATFVSTSSASLKPVLNWVNVCSLNILRTVRRTMIRFLTELLVRRTWFGQFDELYFVLNWLVMRCKLRPELAAEAQQTAWSKCRIKSSQYTFIIPHRVIQLTTISFWVPGQGCAFHKSTNKQIPTEASEEPSDIVIHFYFYFFLIHRRALLSASQRRCSSNRANVPRTC